MPALKTRIAIAIFRRYPALIEIKIESATGTYLWFTHLDVRPLEGFASETRRTLQVKSSWFISLLRFAELLELRASVWFPKARLHDM